MRIMLQWTWECRYFFEIRISFPLEIHPKVELLDHMVILFLISLRISILFSIMAVLIYIPTNSVQGFSFLHILANTIFCILDNSYSNRCEVMSCGFDLCVADDEWYWTPFHVLAGPSLCLVWKNMHSIPLPIFFLFVCFDFLKYLFIFEKESVSRRGQRERELQNPKQVPGSELSAQSPTQGSNSWAARSWGSCRGCF